MLSKIAKAQPLLPSSTIPMRHRNMVLSKRHCSVTWVVLSSPTPLPSALKSAGTHARHQGLVLPMTAPHKSPNLATRSIVFVGLQLLWGSFTILLTNTSNDTENPPLQSQKCALSRMHLLSSIRHTRHIWLKKLLMKQLMGCS